MVLRAVPLIETVEDLASLATEEKASFYEFNESGETERNTLSHECIFSEEDKDAQEFEFPADKDVVAAIRGGRR